MTSLLEAHGVAINGRLSPANLNCEPGELVAVIGPNGAGKTSLLRALAGIELDGGDVLIDGETVAHAPPPRRMKLLSLLPATRSVIWPITARDVIGLGLPSPDLPRVEELIEMLELQPLADRRVNHLSTGERSRVLLARALAAKPRLLLLDEPLSNMDPHWVLRTLQILRAEAQASQSTVLASLHDLGQVEAFNRLLLVAGGRIVADGAPRTILESPELAHAFRIQRAGSGWKIEARN